jgi:RHS repeat-associated protein
MSSRSGGQPDSASAPNGNTIAYVYDTAGQLSSMVTTNSGGTPADYSWTRNRAGQLLSEDSEIDNDPANGTTTYTYDPLARLSDYTRAGSTTAYDWQAVPNRTSVQVDANDPVTYYFDDANREYDSSLGTITYNDEGQLTGYPGQVLDWNDLGQLTTVKDSTTQDPIAAYTYDALDRLLTVDHGAGDVVRFRYVGLSTAVAQVVDDATDDVLYSVANDWTGARLFEWDGSSETFYGTNAHHDVTWTADSSGDVSATLRYDPWGNLTASWAAYLPAFRFQGSWFDPTVELSWVVARWYAPELGRFISEDSLLGSAYAPPSLHLYAYGASDPIGRLDPLGTMPLPIGGTNMSYTYRTNGNWDLGAIAYHALGTFGAWKMIFRANRALLGPAETANAADLLLPRGTCIWIPRGWMYPAGHGTNETACAPAQQMPDLQNVFRGQPQWDRWVSIAQRTEGLSSRYLLSFSEQTLHKLTKSTLGSCLFGPCRPKDPTIDNLAGKAFYLSLPGNLIGPNVVAAAMAQLNGWVPKRVGFAWDVRIVNGSPLGQPITFGSTSSSISHPRPPYPFMLTSMYTCCSTKGAGSNSSKPIWAAKSQTRSSITFTMSWRISRRFRRACTRR